MLLSLYIINILYSTIHLISIPAQPPLLYTQKIILSIHILKFFCKHIMNIIMFILISFSSLYFHLFFISLIYILQFFSKIFSKNHKKLFKKPLPNQRKYCKLKQLMEVMRWSGRWLPDRAGNFRRVCPILNRATWNWIPAQNLWRKGSPCA